MSGSFVVTVGSIVLALALIAGWIALVIAGKTVDTEYVTVTVLAVGHAIGINTGATVTSKP